MSDNILLLICGKQKVVLMSQHENRIHPCSTYRALNDWTLNGPGKTGASITPHADYYPSILATYVFKNNFHQSYIDLLDVLKVCKIIFCYHLLALWPNI